MKRSRLSIAAALVGLIFFGSPATLHARTCCEDHGGVVKHLRHERSVVCSDGTEDKGCKAGAASRPVKQLIHFKPRPDRGQVLRPGETPPPTTLKDAHLSHPSSAPPAATTSTNSPTR